MRLFCLPYAGGSATVYNKWKVDLNPLIHLEPIELKGRGKRFDEKLYESLDEAVEDTFDIIKNKIENDDYAIYGHSMGALLAYELYYKIINENYRKPKHMFFSGCRAPSIVRCKNLIHTLPDEELIKKIISLGGTPKEIIYSKQLLNIVVPIIRSDFKMLENYDYEERMNKIQCDISILHGKKDDIVSNQVLAWGKHGDKEFRVYYFDGNHFFINDNAKKIADIINKTLIKMNRKYGQI